MIFWSNSPNGKQPVPDEPKPQLDKFKDLARELGVDENENRFVGKLKKVAKTPPPRPSKK